MKIELPFPPSSLSGHNNGHWRNKSGDVAKHRRWAKCATMNVFGTQGLPESSGDINLTVRFIPANNRFNLILFRSSNAIMPSRRMPTKCIRRLSGTNATIQN